jgi:hypothetical protein
MMRRAAPSIVNDTDVHRRGRGLHGAESLSAVARVAAGLRGVPGRCMTTDAHHVTAPHPEGEGMIQAMKRLTQPASRPAKSDMSTRMDRPAE